MIRRNGTAPRTLDNLRHRKTPGAAEGAALHLSALAGAHLKHRHKPQTLPRFATADFRPEYQPAMQTFARPYVSVTSSLFCSTVWPACTLMRWTIPSRGVLSSFCIFIDSRIT